ncbi:hypothetical protein SAMN05421736_101491 [Evansella caseinilytica]|uniref:Uncharacterized protein n=1 Tax=Evansella caseinilytica TaxID=1503961 RepID=A0A1H3HIC2_9BACI|nr:hypothetical protein [Evansella caseinilytica]SDY14558.1 hypothetical protein SAMN05421736_101491 [Evansella caseinilytica]
MRNKRLYITGIIVIAFFLVACIHNEDPNKYISEIYCIVLDTLMEESQQLNKEMAFIAVDMTQVEELNEQENGEITTYLEDKYGVEVMLATYEELTDQGLYDPETSALDGVLLKINKIHSKTNHAVIEAEKYRAGDGAIGMEYTIHYKSRTWQVKEASMIWIS